jgi:hexokinase
MAMGKGFAISSKLDLGPALLKGYEKSRGATLPPLEVAAIANDSVATLVSFIYQSQESATRKAAMGLICGTGCNATIPLRKSSLHRDKLPIKVGVVAADDEENVKVAVNTELSINGTAPALQKFGLISEWDRVLDEQGDKPGFQPLEYMTAGRYLGELGRLILVDYLNQLGHPEAALPPLLLERFGLSTTFLSKFKSANAAALVQKLEAEFPTATADFHWTEDIALAVYEIAKAIEVRAAGIIAASVIGLLACAGDISLRQSLGEKDQTAPTNGSHPPIDLIVGYTGGCIAHFQDYLEDCQKFLDGTIEAEYGESAPVRVLLSACHDGGITGAGVLAGSAQAKCISTSEA